MTDKAYWVVMKVFRWDDMRIEAEGNMFPIAAEIKGPASQVGFLPVFDNYEDAVKLAGDEDLVWEAGEVPHEAP